MGCMLPSPQRACPGAPPPSLPPAEDLLFEILLRLPPDPDCLHRAALVCRRWRRLIHGPAFLPRFRAFHRTSPVLGFYHNSRSLGPSFVALAAPAGPSLVFGDGDWSLLGCRHGRVLLRSGPGWLQLLVWDPVTGHRSSVRLGRLAGHVRACNAAVLGDQDTRRHGSFRVAFVFTGEGRASACLYSSETAAWGRLITAGTARCGDVGKKPSALAGDALYWALDDGRRRHPRARHGQGDPRRGRAAAARRSGSLWARESGGADGVASTSSWVLLKSIDLDVFAPMPLPCAGGRVILVPPVRLLGVDEGGISAFIWTIEGIFMLHLEDEMLMKMVAASRVVDFVYPYSSVYVAGGGGEGEDAGAVHGSGRL
uniref:F-box domain-containing protein n=1 Tax=Oryza nivara TaxID=4536 RepID=A0A0E0IV92_ORYNI